MSYRDAGVDIDRADRLVGRIKSLAEGTRTAGVLGSIGGFGGLFELPLARYREPVLVSGTDGVGTKLRLAIDTGVHDTVGVDLVAMCVNDILALGAQPLYFLDYFATGRLDVDVAEAVIRGIARGCELAGTALIGGETAELPGMYATGDYDLAGFCVGIVEKSEIIDGSRAEPGSVLLGIASSGPHANGFSLIRKVLANADADLGTQLGNRTLGEALLEPTRIYAQCLQQLINELPVTAIAHITGGGLTENIPRVLPANTLARVDVSSWRRAPIFDWIQETGVIEDHEMYRTFNCGIGMVVCVDAGSVEQACSLLEQCGEEVVPIGTVESTVDSKPRVVLDGL